MIQIAAVMIMCFGAFGLFHSYLHRRGVDYATRPWLVAGYFFAVAWITARIFWSDLHPVLLNFDRVPVNVFAVFLLLQVIFFISFQRNVREPREYFERFPDRSYLKLDIERLFSKYFDIVAQQIFIVLLVVFLQKIGLTLAETILAFAALFSVLHIPLMIVEWGKWPMYVFGAAVISFSIVFPILIIYVPYGFLYNIMLHWSFYMILAAVFWLRYRHQVQ